jgi:hypothetical protein
MVAPAHCNLQKIGCRSASGFRFVHQLVFLAADKCPNRACKKPASDSREREKIAPGWQQRLHRAIIDTSFERFLAREFWKPGTTASQAVAP